MTVKAPEAPPSPADNERQARSSAIPPLVIGVGDRPYAPSVRQAAQATAHEEQDQRPRGLAASAGASGIDPQLGPRRLVTGPAWPRFALGGVTTTLMSINKEIWLVLSMLGITAALNFLITANHMVLGLYALPTVFSAYALGRRHATLTAIASSLLVGLLLHFQPDLLARTETPGLRNGQLIDLVAWGGILVLVAYTTGTLHERHQRKVAELRRTYRGLLVILRQFISNDKYTENHSYRVSVYAATLATYLHLSESKIETIRAAALLHDIGKLDVSRELLHKAVRLSSEEMSEVRSHVDRGARILEPIGDSLGEIIPIILAHHDHFDGTGHSERSGEEIPFEARIIRVADVYDALTSDRPYRKAMPPHEAREMIVGGSGTDFDPRVVRAFLAAYQRGALEVPEILL